MRGLLPVCGRRLGEAIGVRMVIAGNRCAALPCSAMGIDKHLRIDLEVVFPLRVDILCGQECRDTPILFQQDPATLARVGIGGMAKDAGNNRA